MNTTLVPDIDEIIEEACSRQIHSKYIFERTRNLNIQLTTLITMIGLVGNSLAIFVFSQKRFRRNSASVYLLCLAISDGLFLLTHFFEDTLRTYIDLYLNQNIKVHEKCQNHKDLKLYNITEMYKTDLSESFQHFIRLMNIIDRFDFFCILFNYFRYILRFISAYIIVAFTVHRALAIYKPYTEYKLDSKKVTWIAATVITVFAFLLSIWVPFLFRTAVYTDRTGNMNLKYCDIRTEFQFVYFTITIIYIFIIMLIPIILIFVCNLFIIMSIFYASKKRKLHLNESFKSLTKTRSTNGSTIKRNSNNNTNHYLKKSNKSVRFDKDVEMSVIAVNPVLSNQDCSQNQPRNESVVKKTEIVNKLTSRDTRVNSMLMFMSLSYAMLNLPHFITWMIFFYHVAFKPKTEISATQSSIENSTSNNKFFAANYISEIFYVLNYGIHFFIYCASEKRFRTQLMSALRCLFFKTQIVQKSRLASDKANNKNRIDYKADKNEHKKILIARRH